MQVWGCTAYAVESNKPTLEITGAHDCHNTVKECMLLFVRLLDSTNLDGIKANISFANMQFSTERET